MRRVNVSVLRALTRTGYGHGTVGHPGTDIIGAFAKTQDGGFSIQFDSLYLGFAVFFLFIFRHKSISGFTNLGEVSIS